MEKTPAEINQAVVECRQCPRLAEWREKVAMEKVRRFKNKNYWGKPVPAFGDTHAQLIIVGLAPAAHGANRTGRMFTGDRSGDWLYRALHTAGFANQPQSIDADDGLTLKNCYITAACRCPPPANKPTVAEFNNCRNFLVGELKWAVYAWSERQIPGVVLCLGGLALQHTLKALNEFRSLKSKPKFGHNTVTQMDHSLFLLTSYHPSQQNTFTGRLTQEMFDDVFVSINRILASRG